MTHDTGSVRCSVLQSSFFPSGCGQSELLDSNERGSTSSQSTYRQWIDRALAIHQEEDPPGTALNFFAIRHVLERSTEAEQREEDGKVGNQEIIEPETEVERHASGHPQAMMECRTCNPQGS